MKFRAVLAMSLVALLALGAPQAGAGERAGSVAEGDDPGILALFPNNAPPDQGAIVGTTT